MQITLRIYRTHDYDLMALHCSGVVNFPKAARKALVSYYKEEPIRIATVPGMEIIPDDLPSILEFNVSINEQAVPGFSEWFAGIKRGYRNNFAKNLLRQCLDGFCIELYRSNSHRVKFDKADNVPISIPVKKRKTKETATGSAWVEEVAQKKYTKNENAKISDIGTLLDREKNKKTKKRSSAEQASIKSEGKHINKGAVSTGKSSSDSSAPMMDETKSRTDKIAAGSIMTDASEKAMPIPDSEKGLEYRRNNDGNRSDSGSVISNANQDNATNEDDFDAFDTLNDLMRGI